MLQSATMGDRATLAIVHQSTFVLALPSSMVYTYSKSKQGVLPMKRILVVIILAAIVLTGLFLHPWKTASAAASPTDRTLDRHQVERRQRRPPGNIRPAQWHDRHLIEQHHRGRRLPYQH